MIALELYFIYFLALKTADDFQCCALQTSEECWTPCNGFRRAHSKNMYTERLR